MDCPAPVFETGALGRRAVSGRSGLRPPSRRRGRRSTSAGASAGETPETATDPALEDYFAWSLNRWLLPRQRRDTHQASGEGLAAVLGAGDDGECGFFHCDGTGPTRRELSRGGGTPNALPVAVGSYDHLTCLPSAGIDWNWRGKVLAPARRDAGKTVELESTLRPGCPLEPEGRSGLPRLRHPLPSRPSKGSSRAGPMYCSSCSVRAKRHAQVRLGNV